MIDDSYAWKDRIRRGRAILRRKVRDAVRDPKRAEAAFVEVEAFAFLTGYIVRKLIEAKKLSDELEAAVMSVLAYPARPGYALDFSNAHKIDRGYDLAAPTLKTIGLRTLCNLLVHSFVFMPVADEGQAGWSGFFVNSDHNKNKELFFIAREDFDLLVDEVVGDYIVTMHIDRIRNRLTKSRVANGDPAPTITLNVTP